MVDNVAPSGKLRYWTMPVALFGVMIGTLHVREGRLHNPYYDIGHVLTVCDGITGPDVVYGKYYDDAACDALEAKFMKRTTDAIGKCIPVPLAREEWLAYGDFTWNVGARAFCTSGSIRYLKKGLRYEACDNMLKYRFAAGRDCSIRANGCPGVWSRRQWEANECKTGVE